MESHLLQMRGLKQILTRLKGLNSRSHLLQMRGLKPEQVVIINIWPESHLLQMRGLKQSGVKIPIPPESRNFYRCVY